MPIKLEEKEEKKEIITEEKVFGFKRQSTFRNKQEDDFSDFEDLEEFNELDLKTSIETSFATGKSEQDKQNYKKARGIYSNIISEYEFGMADRPKSTEID